MRIAAPPPRGHDKTIRIDMVKKYFFIDHIK